MPSDAIPTLAVLAGGAGARMGGPKSLLTIGGQPILAYLHARFGWEGHTLLVTSPGRERPPGAELFDREVVDAVAGEGPVRGLLTALEACSTEMLVVVTVDMPGVSRGQVEWVAEQMRSDAVLIRRSEHIEPFPSAYRREFADTVLAQLRSGDGSMRGLVGQSGVDLVQAPREWSEETWTNLNRPDDLTRWARVI